MTYIYIHVAIMFHVAHGTLYTHPARCLDYKCHLTITCCFQQTPFNMLNILYYVCDTRMNFYIFLKW